MMITQCDKYNACLNDMLMGICFDACLNLVNHIVIWIHAKLKYNVTSFDIFRTTFDNMKHALTCIQHICYGIIGFWIIGGSYVRFP